MATLIELMIQPANIAEMTRAMGNSEVTELIAKTMREHVAALRNNLSLDYLTPAELTEFKELIKTTRQEITSILLLCDKSESSTAKSLSQKLKGHCEELDEIEQDLGIEDSGN